MKLHEALIEYVSADPEDKELGTMIVSNGDGS